MLELTLTILALAAAGLIVWVGARRSKAVRQLSGQLSGPLEQMQEQILLTADSAVGRLDSKIAQMESLLSEIDRRSNNLAQQSQQLQMKQLQLEQQQQQFKEWLQKKQQQLEKEYELRQRILENSQRQNAIATRSPLVVDEAVVPVKLARPAPIALQDKTQEFSAMPNDPVPAKPVKPVINSSISEPLVQDKRSRILDMAEQGWSETDIAQKMGIGKGEVMLLLKLRKKKAN